jgi:hypothetical protein
MLEMQSIKRVTVYATKALEDNLLGHFLSLGSTGYTVTECRGKGDKAVLDDPMCSATHVRIEVLVQPHVAEKIMKFLDLHHLRSQAVAACVEDVQVPKADHY